VAFAGIISPSRAIASYDGLLRYLEAQLDLSVTVAAGRGYAETNRLLRIGDADLGFVCTYAYVRGHDEFGLRLLVAPVGGYRLPG
jgi:phosphonate transport system substrate-binding protein